MTRLHLLAWLLPLLAVIVALVFGALLGYLLGGRHGTDIRLVQQQHETLREIARRADAQARFPRPMGTPKGAA